MASIEGHAAGPGRQAIANCTFVSAFGNRIAIYRHSASFGAHCIALHRSDPLQEPVARVGEIPFGGVVRRSMNRPDRDHRSARDFRPVTDIEAFRDRVRRIVKDQVVRPKHGQPDPGRHAGQDQSFRARGELWRRHRYVSTQVLRHHKSRRPPRRSLRGGSVVAEEAAIPSGSRGSRGGLSCL